MQLATPNCLARMHDQPCHPITTYTPCMILWQPVFPILTYCSSFEKLLAGSSPVRVHLWTERAKNAIRNTFTYCRNWQSSSRSLQSLRIASGSSSEKFLVCSSPIKRWLRGQRDRQEYKPLSALLLELVRLILKRRWMDGIEEEYFHTTISVE